MIRRADLSDVEAIIPGLMDFYREVGLAPLDLDKMTTNLVILLQQHFVLVAEEDGKVIGALGLWEQELWYSRATRIVNAFFFVDRDQRHADVGRALLSDAKVIAEERGSLLEIDVINIERRRGRIAEKLGFVPVGYLSRLGGGHVPVRQQRLDIDADDGAGQPG